jgi:hypothetical protein
MSPRLLWGARFVLFAVVSGASLLGIAMWIYPGGTAVDPDAPGHSFWLNFLCDLTEPVARNGVPSPTGSALARAGMLDLSLALGAVWLIGPALLPDHRAAARLIRGAGALCAVALVAVPLVPGVAHMLAIFTSSATGLAAGVMTLVVLVRGGGPRHVWLLLVAVLVTTAADSVFYAQSMASHARVIRPELPAVQRLAGLLALAWMIATALAVLRARPRPPATEAARPARS